MAHLIDGSGNPGTFTDVHAASDGRLIRYPLETQFNTADKQRLIAGLVDVVRERANPAVRDLGIQGLQIIGRDAGGPANFQGADQMFADDIVAEICALLVRVEEPEVVNTVVNHLCEQFGDMIRTNGMCPSGRLNRASQVRMFLRDYLAGAHLPPK